MARYIVSNTDSIDWNVSGTKRVIQNVCNLLKTKMYEVPFMREMGIDPDIFDNPQSSVEHDLKINVQEMISEYEPRATVLDVEVGSVSDDGNLTIKVEIEVED